MESTASVSKGVFLFHKAESKVSKQKKKVDLFQKIFQDEPWYLAFKENWEHFEREIQSFNQVRYSSLLNNVVKYIKSFYKDNESEELNGVIPSATLLTGVNQPDHVSQYNVLKQKLREHVTPHIAMVNSQDSSSLKSLVENTVWQLMYGSDILEDFEDECLEDAPKQKKLRKNQCTMKELKKWYDTQYINVSPHKKKLMMPRKQMVVIIPDFESFNCNILQDFVMIVSSYVSGSLPLVLVFGVATSISALHNSFPYHVSSKLLIKVFQPHSSPVYLNQVLENIFLTHTSPFHLSGRAFQLLIDVFLFYDFSVKGLIQSYKYCMMEHYYGDNTKSLCCPKEELQDTIMKLSANDLSKFRNYPSLQPFIESQGDKIKDSNYFKEELLKRIFKLHDYLYTFYFCIRLLHSLIKDIPKNTLGKSVREIYAKCAAESITSTSEFQDCMTLIKFQPQVKLVEDIKDLLKIFNLVLKNLSSVKPLIIKNSTDKLIVVDDELGETFIKNVQVEEKFQSIASNRYKLKEKLLKATKMEKVKSEFEIVRAQFVNYLIDLFTIGLQPPHTQILHELFFFADVPKVKKQILGAPRGAIHSALSNPGHYLECTCCHVKEEGGINGQQLDVCVAYQLYCEYGRLINLYDWLQAFAVVLRPDNEDAHHDADLQARFTRAVAELQFLGFIKSSKRKTDHVVRLTW
ncbi:hypothetical protein ACJJTC_015713 [Scirpophaga incertulas]